MRGPEGPKQSRAAGKILDCFGPSGPRNDDLAIAVYKYPSVRLRSVGMTELKETLRTEALRHRAMLDPRDEDPEGAAGIFFDVLAPGPDIVVATYWPKDKEFDPYPILERLLKQGNPCCLPIVQKESRELKFAPWREGDKLEKGPYDVMQPAVTPDTVFAEPDLLIVPLLAFDRRGYRLGYGGGYYDATLRALRQKKTITAVGVAYARQACLFNLPADENDEKLDLVITPEAAHDFRNRG